MDATWIIAVFVITDDLMERLDHHDHALAQVPDAEVVTTAIVAARYFGNHHERALQILLAQHYLSGHLSTSRFNRRVHALADWIGLILAVLGEVFRKGDCFVIDSLPIPVCKRARARRCRTVRGRAFCGYCAAKKEKFFGWRLHLVCTPSGVPVAFELLPAAFHDLTPIHELTVGLPPGSRAFGDKAYNSAHDEATILAETGVRLVPIRKANMHPHEWVDEYELRLYRHTIETLNSQLEAMGIERLHVRSTDGLQVKVLASLAALACSNLN
ncbi:MAG: hypothetical protein C4346_18160 [Chloroflexota bacterium]